MTLKVNQEQWVISAWKSTFTDSKRMLTLQWWSGKNIVCFCCCGICLYHLSLSRGFVVRVGILWMCIWSKGTVITAKSLFVRCLDTFKLKLTTLNVPKKRSVWELPKSLTATLPWPQPESFSYRVKRSLSELNEYIKENVRSSKVSVRTTRSS